MQPQFECIKIKDGLYLGNIEAAKDYEFLVINKFAYVVNCSAETPNHFETMGIKYLNFKLLKDKQHKLFNQSLKKLTKLENFVFQAEENSLCCLVTSQQSNNRSLVMIVAYLMSKFRWTLRKTLQFIRSKSIYISLNDHYINQLEILEEILNRIQGLSKLSQTWKGVYISDQQEIVSKTFLNSQQATMQISNPIIDLISKPKKTKRVVWQDKLEKQQKKNIRQQKSKEMKESKDQSKQSKDLKQPKQNKQKQRKSLINNQNKQRKVLTNNFMNNIASDQNISQKLKSSKDRVFGNKSTSLNKISVHSDKQNTHIYSQPKFQKVITQQKSQQHFEIKQQFDQSKASNQIINDKDIIKLIKKNLKISMLNEIQNIDEKKGQLSDKKNTKKSSNIYENYDKQYKQKGRNHPIYNLTINNYITPNIQIMSENGNICEGKDKIQKREGNKQKHSKQTKKSKHTEKNNFKGTGFLAKNIKQKGKVLQNENKKQVNPKQKLQKANSVHLKRVKD